MFKRYESKPTTRLAHKIEAVDAIIKVVAEEATYTLKVPGGKEIKFKAHEPVNIGDYVVYLTETDIYHCSAKVFAERNII